MARYRCYVNPWTPPMMRLKNRQQCAGAGERERMELACQAAIPLLATGIGQAGGEAGVRYSPAAAPPVKSWSPFFHLPPTLYFLLLREKFLE